MRRLIGVLTVAVLGGALFSLLARVDVIKAIGGLSGRTHLIVKEQNLVHLISRLESGCGYAFTVTATSAELHPLRTYDRQENCPSSEYYTVPSGRTFVATDIYILGGRTSGSTGAIEFTLTNDAPPVTPTDQFGRWLLIPFKDTYTNTPTWFERDYHLTGGIPFDAGQNVSIKSYPLVSGNSIWSVYVNLLGYETEADA